MGKISHTNITPQIARELTEVERVNLSVNLLNAVINGNSEYLPVEQDEMLTDWLGIKWGEIPDLMFDFEPGQDDYMAHCAVTGLYTQCNELILCERDPDDGPSINEELDFNQGYRR